MCHLLDVADYQDTFEGIEEKALIRVKLLHGKVSRTCVYRCWERDDEH